MNSRHPERQPVKPVQQAVTRMMAQSRLRCCMVLVFSLIAALAFVATTQAAGAIPTGAETRLEQTTPACDEGAGSTLTIHKSIVGGQPANRISILTFRVMNEFQVEIARPVLILDSDEAEQSVQVTGLLPGVYTVIEDPVVGWDLQLAQTVTVGQAPECNATVAFTNRERGAITITKQTTPDTCGKRWRFDALDLGPFSLRGGQSMPFAELTATQVYTIYETNLPNGWALEIQCEGATASILREVVRDSIEGGDEGESCEGEQGESGTEHTGGPPKDYGVEILLAPGEQVTCTFHNMRKPQIRVVKLEDADADGILTGDEAPLARWQFSIYQQVDGVWQQIKKTKTTAADGMTTFGALEAGEYMVCEALQAGWSNTVPGAANVAPPALLAKGYACQTTTVEGEFGFRRYLRFGNVRSGNVAIQKTTSPENGGEFGFSQMIDDSGAFMLGDGGIAPFVDIRPGAYTVTEDQLPDGWALAQIQCSDGDSPVPSVTDLPNRAVTVNVEPGETVLCTFVNVQSGNVEIGVVTNPPDGAGFAFDQSIDGTGSFTLDDSVARGFPNVASGAYLINQAAPSGWVLDAILCDDAASALASVVDPTGQAVTVQVEPGEDVSCQFLFSALGTVVIEKQTDPPGGGGFLFRPGFDGENPISLADGGRVSYTGLVAGDYVVAEEFAPAGWKLTAITCDDGASDNPSTGDLQNAAVLVGVEPGESVTCIFTNSLVDGAVIGDLVWMDTVADGMQGDPALEPGVPGVQVRLYEAAGELVDERTTDSTGHYRFEQVVPGAYKLAFSHTFPDKIWTVVNSGGDASRDSDAALPASLGDDQSRFSALFTVVAGQEDLSWDAGLATVAGAATATVGDYVWLDSNKNGIQDSEESGVPGVELQLYRLIPDAATTPDKPIATTQTDSAGYYLFEGLDPAQYWLSIMPPPLHRISAQLAGTDRMRDSDFDADGRTLPFFLPEGVIDLTWDVGLVADTVVEPTVLRPVDEPTLLGYRVLLPLIREK